VVIGILVAVAVVAAAIVAVTILGSDDGDSMSDPTDVPTTDGSTTVPTTSTAMDLPTAAAGARIDAVVDESGVGDDGRYSIEDQECPLADVTVRGLVDAMLALGDGPRSADGPVTATVRDIRFDGPTIMRSCQLPEENGCGVGWVGDEIANYVGVEDELAG